MVALNYPSPRRDDAADVLAEAERAGLLIWVEAGRIAVEGPPSAASVVARIAAAKPAVLALLSARDLAPLPGVSARTSPSAPWCGYGHPVAWRSRYGPHLICSTCHPPASPDAVVETVRLPR